MEEDNEESQVFLCPGCQRPETHKMCPAYGTPYYMSGQLFTEEMEEAEILRISELLNDPDKNGALEDALKGIKKM